MLEKIENILKTAIEKIENILKTAIIWLVVSSENPDKVSLTIKMGLLGVMPYIMTLAGLVCNVWGKCIDVDATGLQLFFENIGNLVFHILTVISIAGSIYGMLRKMFLTVTGKNKALQV